MPSPRSSLLVTRITLAFGVFALLVTLLAWLAWRAQAEATRASEAVARSEQALSVLNELDAITQPRAARALCAATGGPALNPADTAATPWQDVAARLNAIVGRPDEDDPRSADRVAALGRLTQSLQQWEQSFEAPMRTACEQGQRLGAGEVLARLRVVAPTRARLDDDQLQLRNLLLEERRRHAEAVASAAHASRRSLALLSLCGAMLGLAALLAVRSFLVQIADLQRRLFDERYEREMAREELAVSQRRMRVLVDHVKDAVIAFDGRGHIQWVNPSGEAMFGSSREQLTGYPVTLLMPELESELASAASPDRATVLDEHGLPWVSQRLTLQGVRRRAGDDAQEKFTLDVSFVQTRSGSQTVGVCVARDLSELRRLQREGEAVLSTLQHRLLPQARAAEAAAKNLNDELKTRAVVSGLLASSEVGGGASTGSQPSTMGQSTPLSGDALRKLQAVVRQLEELLSQRGRA